MNKDIVINNIKIKSISNKKTILENIEQNNIKINFQCRIGICGICKALLTKGKIYYIKTPLAILKNKEILLCIAKHINNIEINYKLYRKK